MNETPKVFLVRAGKYGEDEDVALDNDLVLVRFMEMPSLSTAKNYEDIAAIVAANMPDAKPRAITNLAGQLWTFAYGMEVGDLVVLPRKQSAQIAIGRVTGPYLFRDVDGVTRHTRAVHWERPDVPRSAFAQDMLYSFGAFMTVCNISRNDAEKRVAAVLAGKPDPGPSLSYDKKHTDTMGPDETDDVPNLGQLAHDQIVAHIQSRFAGHDLASLVEAVLRADGWTTKLSPPGPDGGVDILGGRGSLGLDAPRLCVQVKSQNSPVDVTVYRNLQGSMQSFKAEQGLLVCWGGFNKAVLAESRQGHFTVRLWDSSDVVKAIYRTYEQLPPDIQTDLPLERTWTLVRDEDAG